MRKADFYPTANELKFVDSEKHPWIAPKGTLTDGASIPPVFVSVIGSPTSQEFVNAAAIHDAYCGIGNEKLPQYHTETWQNVHRMFYDALRVGGTSPKKAKIMFAAVYLGGPRWHAQRRVDTAARHSETARGNHLSLLRFSTKSDGAILRRDFSKNLKSKGMASGLLQQELRNVVEFIELNSPTIAQLERHLIKREIILRARLDTMQDDDDGYPDDGYPGGGYPGGGYPGYP